jgi:phage terminase large subunit-like protein
MRSDTEFAKLFWSYIYDVESGRLKTGKWTKLVIKRFRKDRRKREFDFDVRDAAKVCRFVEALKHIKGDLAGQSIVLEPWQIFFIFNVYGWKKKNGRRRFRRALLFVARKNGKTLLAAALAVHALLTEAGAEVYTLASTKEQANLAFNNAREFVRKNKDLSALLELYQYDIRNVETASYMKALSSEYGTHDGLNPQLALADEIAAHKDYGAINVIRSGMKARSEPLMLMITTAGYSTAEDNPGYQENQLAKKLLEGIHSDDGYFVQLYELDEDDNWQDETNYIKANPNLGVSIELETLVEERNEAIQKPTYQAELFTKTLNRFLEKSVTSQWFSATAIKRTNQKEIILRPDMPVAGAIDLSKRIDFTAYTKCFYDDETDKYILKHIYYIPEDQVEEKMKNDSSMVWNWINEGLIVPTPGSTVDYSFLINDILKDKQELPNYTDIVFDRWSATETVEELKDHFNMIEMDMSTKAMSEPSKDFETLMLDERIVDRNPVAHWMLSNAQVFVDYAGNIKIRKIDYRSSSIRIDSVITSIMATNHVKNYIVKNMVARATDWSQVVY